MENSSLLTIDPKNSIRYLNISKSNIDFESTVYFNNLILLDLSSNGIHNTSILIQFQCKKLQSLILKNNPLKLIKNSQLNFFKTLLFLDISETSIKFLTKLTFSGLENLKTLKMTNCFIKFITSDSLESLKNLEVLNMRGTRISDDFSLNFIKPARKLKYLYSNKFELCCIVKKISLKLTKCHPMKSLIRTCNDLISNQFLRIAIWIIIFLGLSGNSIAVIRNIKSSDSSRKKFHLGLSLSDFAIGIYLLVLAIVDRKFNGVYLEHASQWKKSGICIFFGVFASTFILYSNICLLYISIDRFLAVCHPLKHLSMDHNRISAVMLLSFSIVTLIFLTPLFVFKVIDI